MSLKDWIQEMKTKPGVIQAAAAQAGYDNFEPGIDLDADEKVMNILKQNEVIKSGGKLKPEGLFLKNMKKYKNEILPVLGDTAVNTGKDMLEYAAKPLTVQAEAAGSYFLKPKKKGPEVPNGIKKEPAPKTNDPQPQRKDYPAGIDGDLAFKTALDAWTERNA